MLKIFIPLLVIGAIFLSWNWRGLESQPSCAEPLAYAIGSFDRRFDVSQKEFLSALAEAESVWEIPSNINLFTYAPESGELAVNLIYDYRQEVTKELDEIESGVRENEADYRELETDYARLKSEYAALKNVYDTQAALLDGKTAAYESNVRAWNESDRTSRSQFEALETERLALERELAQVKVIEGGLNRKVQELNALVGRLNRLARSLNLNVEEYNTVGASRGETFAGGIYSESSEGQKIDIYEFESREKLVRILAHELGHALGLGHIDDPKAIMYELNESDAGIATASDLAALNALCVADK